MHCPYNTDNARHRGRSALRLPRVLVRADHPGCLGSQIAVIASLL